MYAGLALILALGGCGKTAEEIEACKKEVAGVPTGVQIITYSHNSETRLYVTLQTENGERVVIMKNGPRSISDPLGVAASLLEARVQKKAAELERGETVVFTGCSEGKILKAEEAKIGEYTINIDGTVK